jgi:signal transduction histidine kinase
MTGSEAGRMAGGPDRHGGLDKALHDEIGRGRAASTKALATQLIEAHRGRRTDRFETFLRRLCREAGCAAEVSIKKFDAVERKSIGQPGVLLVGDETLQMTLWSPTPGLVYPRSLLGKVTFRSTPEQINALRSDATLLTQGLASLVETDHVGRLRAKHRSLSHLITHVSGIHDIEYQLCEAVREVCRYSRVCAIYSCDGPTFRRLAFLPSKIRDQTSHLARDLGMPGIVDISDRDAHVVGTLYESRVRHAFVAPLQGAGAIHAVEVNDQSASVAVRPTNDAEKKAIQTLRELLLGQVKGAGVESVVLIPVVHTGRVVGLVVLLAGERTPSTLHVAAAAELAQYAAPAIQRDADLRAELDLLESTAATWLGDSSGGGAQTATFDLVAARIRTLRNADAVLIAPLNHRADDLDPDTKVLSVAPDVIVGVNVQGVVASKQTSDAAWFRGGSESSESVMDIVAEHSLETAIHLPLTERVSIAADQLSYDRPLGVFLVGFASNRTDRPFSDAEWAWYRRRRDIVTSMLIAKRRAWSRALTEHDQRRLQAIVLRRLPSATTFDDIGRIKDELLALLMESAISTTGAGGGIVCVPSTEHACLSICAAVGLESPSIGDVIELGAGSSGSAAETRTSVAYYESLGAHLDAVLTPRVSSPPALSELAVPVVSEAGSLLHGIVTIQSSVRRGHFSDAEVADVESLAEVAGLCLDLVAAHAQLQSLRRANDLIDNKGRMEEILATALDEIRETTGALSVSARMLDASGSKLRPVRRVGERGALDAEVIPLGQSVSGWAVQTQRACYIRDVTDVEELGQYPGLKHISSRAEARCEFAVPISFKGDRIGSLNISHAQVDGLSTSRAYIETLSAQVAYAGYHRRRLKRTAQDSDQARVAEVIQAAVAVTHEATGVMREAGAAIDETARDLAMRDESVAQRLRDAARQVSAGEAHLRTFLTSFYEISEAREVIQLPSLVGSVVDSFRREHEGLAQFVYDEQPDRFEVVCSPPVLEQILFGLFRNAVEASAPRRVEIAVSLWRSGDELIVVSICDDGPGVPRPAYDDLFSWTKKTLKPRGSGMGLPTARLLLEGSGGTITAPVRSDTQRGFCIEISLPTPIGAEDLEDDGS